MSGLTDKAGKYFKLPSADKKFFVYSFLRLPLVEYRVRSRGLRPFARNLELAKKIENDPEFLDIQDIVREGRIINQAARFAPLKARCLARSLFLNQLLLQRGIGSSLVVGMEKSSTGFGAHAWLEVDGMVVNDSADAISHFVRIELSDDHIGSLSFG